MYSLTEAELASYRDLGFSGPFRNDALNDDLIERTLNACAEIDPTLAYPGMPPEIVYRQRLDSGKRWWRSLHHVIPEFTEIASHPTMRDRIVSILGPDVLWFGGFWFRQKPGEVHGFHFDSEFTYFDGLTVFIGMKNISQNSSLKVVTRSQKIGVQPSVYVSGGVRGGLSGGKLGDENLVLEAARKTDPTCELVTPDIHPGEFIITEGKLWHGSKNTTDLERTSLILFFTRPKEHARITIAGDATPTHYEKELPCLMLCGDPTGAKNPIIDSPKR